MTDGSCQLCTWRPGRVVSNCLISSVGCHIVRHSRKSRSLHVGPAHVKAASRFHVISWLIEEACDAACCLLTQLLTLRRPDPGTCDATQTLATCAVAGLCGTCLLQVPRSSNRCCQHQARIFPVPHERQQSSRQDDQGPCRDALRAACRRPAPRAVRLSAGCTFQAAIQDTSHAPDCPPWSSAGSGTLTARCGSRLNV